MGMFDYVRFGAQLPGNPPAIEWQTKDTPAQRLDTYVVLADGSLWHQDYDSEQREPCYNFIGEIRFYGYEGDDTKLWWEYSAYFAKGQLKHIELITSPNAQRHGRGETA